MKYCRTFRPSRKLALIGVSMIEPSGRAIRPRIPASWRICAGEPRAPESAYINTELKEDCCSSLPSRLITVSLEIPSIIDLATKSLAREQISITLLYFSPCVPKPEAYWVSISFTSGSGRAKISGLASGIGKSFTPMDEPDLVEKLLPMYIRWLAKNHRCLQT